MHTTGFKQRNTSAQVVKSNGRCVLLSCFLLFLLLCLSGCAGVKSNYTNQDQTVFKPTLEYPTNNGAQVNHPRYQLLHNKYRQWLTDKAIAPNRIDALLDDASSSIVHIVDLQNGDIPEMQFPSWFVAGGSIPADLDRTKILTANKTIAADFKQPSVHSALYIGHVYQKLHCNANNEKPMALEDYRHLHQFFLNEKIWTVEDYQLAESAIIHITDDAKNKQC